MNISNKNNSLEKQYQVIFDKRRNILKEKPSNLKTKKENSEPKPQDLVEWEKALESYQRTAQYVQEIVKRDCEKWDKVIKESQEFRERSQRKLEKLRAGLEFSSDEEY